MKPIDVITGLPRSPDIARIVDAQSRYGEVQLHDRATSFSREMSQKSASVSGITKAEGNIVDTESGGGGGGYAGGGSAGQGHQRGERRHAERADTHPEKGRVLDIRGA